MNQLRFLWRGELPLYETFWSWTVFGGLVVNLASSAGFLFLMTSDRLAAALIIGYGFSLPYNILVSVGVWRSADRYEGERQWADLAKLVTAVGMVLLSVT